MFDEELQELMRDFIMNSLCDYKDLITNRINDEINDAEAFERGENLNYINDQLIELESDESIYATSILNGLVELINDFEEGDEG